MVTEHKEKTLKNLSEKFTTDTLGSIDPQGKCFAISYPLSLHLENKKFENSIVPGHFKDELHPHFWLTIESNKEIIVDPTKKQFCKNAPLVYIGNKPDDYYVRDDTVFENWIEAVYTTWLNPFLFPTFNTHLDINALLEINVKAGTIINNEFEVMKIDINKSLKSKMYFCGIFKILNTKHQNELTEFTKLKGFDNLLSKARNNKCN